MSISILTTQHAGTYSLICSCHSSIFPIHYKRTITHPIFCCVVECGDFSTWAFGPSRIEWIRCLVITSFFEVRVCGLVLNSDPVFLCGPGGFGGPDHFWSIVWTNIKNVLLWQIWYVANPSSTSLSNKYAL